MNAQLYIPLIVERLKKISPYKIILFGSYAYGEPGVDSDIDLLVVTNSDDFPKNYREKSDLYLEVSRVIRDIRTQAPIELIVQTKPMHSRFIELGSMFSKEILQKGGFLGALLGPVASLLGGLLGGGRKR